MAKISEKLNRNDPILHDVDYDEKKIPIAVKVLAVICITVCAICIPVLASYIVDFIKSFFTGAIDKYTSTYILLYIFFLISMASLIVCLILSSVLLLFGKRRKCALTLTISTWSVAIAAISDVMLVGIKIETIALTLAIIALIAVKTYIDPSLAEERKLQKKLQTLEQKAEYEQGTLGKDTEGKGYAKINYFNILLIFVVFAFLGYIWEALWHMIVDEPGVYQERAGFLFGPFSPIYGVGGIIVSVICNKIHDKNPIIVFVVCAALGGMFEFFVSLFLETAFGIRSWDYSQLPLNIDGRVSVRFFIMWGIMGFIYTKFAFKPLINGINKIPWKWRYAITILLSIVVWVNAVMTLQALDCWYERNAGKEMNAPIEQFYNTYFDDDFMKDRFQNMEMNVGDAARTSAENN